MFKCSLHEDSPRGPAGNNMLPGNYTPVYRVIQLNGSELRASLSRIALAGQVTCDFLNSPERAC